MRNPIVKYEKYDGHFRSISHSLLNEPVQSRKFTDWGCWLLFLGLTAGFIAAGVNQIMEYKNMFNQVDDVNDESESLYLGKYWPIVLANIGISLILSFTYVMLIKMFTRAMVYAMMIISMSVLAGFVVVGIFIGNLGLAISMGITLAIYMLILYCLREKIQIGIAMVKVAALFISQKMYIIVSPIINLLLTFTVGLFFSYSMSAMSFIIHHKQQMKQDVSKQAGLMSFMSFVWLFYLFLFYYIMTYTISVVCANWYYGIKGQSSFLTAHKWIFKQLGSLTFGALIVAIVAFARMAVESKRRENGNNKNIIAEICLCLCQFFLRTVEDLLRVLNHYTVIMLSLTGENYIDGAKSTMGLLWRELGLMSICNIICNFLVFWGLIVTVGTPVILSYVMMISFYKQEPSTDAISTIVIIVAFMSMLMSMMIFQIVVESVGCIFVFYSIDKSFVESGMIACHRIPQQNYEQINRYSSNPYGNDDTNRNNNYDKM